MPRSGRLLDKRAVVTGSSQGVGAEIARAFAREGAEVVLCHRGSKGHKDGVADEILMKGGRATTVHADVSDPESVKGMFREVRKALGGLDVLVNAAGLSDGGIWNAKVHEISPEMWERVFSVDTFGTFNCVQGALPLMKKGSIVNVASTPALAGDKEGLVYSSAKGAVVSMTRMLAKSLAPSVRVNCMALGSIATGWVDWLSPSQVREYKAAIPMKDFGTPVDVANLALFLASDESRFMTGQVLVLDGGEVLR